MDSTLALGAFRIARGAGGEGVDVNGSLVEREKGDVWNRNFCVLIDYRLWAAKSEGRPWVDQCLDHHLNLHLNLGVGCAPSCWPIFGFRNLLGARRGHRGQFSVQSEWQIFWQRGRGGEPPQGVAASWGAKAQQVLKKICEIGVGFSFAALSVFRLRRAEAPSAVWIPHWHSEPFESQGARAAKRWT